MYEGVAQAYVLDPTVQAFVQQSNPGRCATWPSACWRLSTRPVADSPKPTLDALRQVATKPRECWKHDNCRVRPSAMHRYSRVSYSTASDTRLPPMARRSVSRAATSL
jgi:cobalamin biosynthesis Mg chelatase CobN